MELTNSFSNHWDTPWLNQVLYRALQNAPSLPPERLNPKEQSYTRIQMRWELDLINLPLPRLLDVTWCHCGTLALHSLECLAWIRPLWACPCTRVLSGAVDFAVLGFPLQVSGAHTPMISAHPPTHGVRIHSDSGISHSWTPWWK